MPAPHAFFLLVGTGAGFHELVPPELISIFTPKELELLISGLPDIDLDDLQVDTVVWADNKYE